MDMRSLTGTLVAVNRPPGWNPMRIGPPTPDLFGLTDATSNCGDESGACAATHDDGAAPAETMPARPARNARTFRMLFLLDVICRPRVFQHPCIISRYMLF